MLRSILHAFPDVPKYSNILQMGPLGPNCLHNVHTTSYTTSLHNVPGQPEQVPEKMPRRDQRMKNRTPLGRQSAPGVTRCAGFRDVRVRSYCSMLPRSRSLCHRVVLRPTGSKSHSAVLAELHCEVASACFLQLPLRTLQATLLPLAVLRLTCPMAADLINSYRFSAASASFAALSTLTFSAATGVIL